MATHSSMLAWKIPWTEDPGGLQSMGSQFFLLLLALKNSQPLSLQTLLLFHFFFAFETLIKVCVHAC